MWLILQQDQPDDYVLATGEAHSVREFVEKAFAHIGRTIVWHGSGVEEKGLDRSTGETLVRSIHAIFGRPKWIFSSVSSKARAKLGWRHRTSFDALVSDMVKADMAAVLAERERRNRHA